MYSCQTICLAHPTHRNSRVGSSPSPAGTRCAPLSPSSRQQQQSGRCCRARAAAAGRWNTHWGSSAGWLQWTLWQLPAAHPESHRRRCRIAHGQWAGSSYGRTGKPIYRLFFFFAPIENVETMKTNMKRFTMTAQQKEKENERLKSTGTQCGIVAKNHLEKVFCVIWREELLVFRFHFLPTFLLNDSYLKKKKNVCKRRILLCL